MKGIVTAVIRTADGAALLTLRVQADAIESLSLGDNLHVLTEAQVGQTFPVPKPQSPSEKPKRVINTTASLEENTQHFKG